MWILLDLFNNKIVEKEIELKKLNSKKSNIQLRKKLKKKRLDILKLSQLLCFFYINIIIF